MSKQRSKRYDSSVYRLNVSYLREDCFGKYIVLGKDFKRKPNISPKLDLLKGQILEQIILRQKHRGLTNYTVAWQTHQSNGLAHLDVLLKYDKRIQKSLSSFDYLLPFCPQELQLLPDKKPRVNITSYSFSKLNLAVLEYGQKEDPEPLNTFTRQQSMNYLVLVQIKKDPYAYFQDVMVKDPYNFDLSYYALKYNLSKQIPKWSALKSKLTDIQAAARSLQQQKKPGIRHVSRQLIQQRLTIEQLKVFDQYPCFQRIVDHVNQIPQYGPDRPHKTLNLHIWGPPGIGKSSLVNQGPVNLAELVPHYDVNIQNKYLNRYYNNVYGFISWNEMKLSDFPDNWILKLLEGTRLEIPIRYSSNVKRDNPLIIATSNLPLTKHIERRFRGDDHLIRVSKSNLIDQRIAEVHVPVPMFFMQKLLVPAESRVQTHVFDSY